MIEQLGNPLLDLLDTFGFISGNLLLLYMMSGFMITFWDMIESIIKENKDVN